MSVAVKKALKPKTLTNSMKKILFSLLLAFVGVASLEAQSTGKVVVSGTVWDAEENNPIEQATVQILSMPDSTYVNGQVSLKGGKFALPAVKPGKYLLKVSFVGYTSQWKTLRLTASKPNVNVGRISLYNDGILMKEAVVTAEAPQVQVVEDTLVYNSSAYRVPEGSALEELVKKLPGAEVDSEGNITVNGKTISKILVDGKEFFGNKKEMAMKNLPVEMVDKLKAYDKKSDLARITGIDDGEEETVLDLTVKKGMKQGWFGNTDLAAGTEDRYSAKLMVNRFTDTQQATAIGSMNNTGEAGFGRRGGGFGGNNGLTTKKEAGFNFALTSSKVEFGGNVSYNYNYNDRRNKTASETFLESGNSFSNSLGVNLSRSTIFNGDFRLEWKPDTMTNIIFRPNFSIGDSWSGGNSQSATFNADPYQDGITDPINQLDDESLSSIRVNRQTNLSNSDGKSQSFNGELQINRKLSNTGRNITLRGSAGYTNNENEQISQSRINYYMVDSVANTNRFITTPTKNWDYSAQLTYSEPLWRATFLQLSYKYRYKYSKSDRSTYDIGDFSFPTLPNGYDDPDNYNAEQSKFAEYKNYIHEISANLRFIRERYQLNLGVTLMPQTSKMSYIKGRVDTVVNRSVTNFTPTVRFRYRFAKQTRLNINYRGSTSQPSMSDLLDVTDDSNPLNISRGNPGLKPSFTNSLRFEFDTYNADRQQGVNVNLRFSNTLNSISNKVTYDSETGGRTTQPENINGNWDTNMFFAFSSALPRNKKFSYNAFTTASYRNMVGFLSQNNADALKNTTRNLTLGERLSGGYRNDWFDFNINGSISHSRVRSSLQKNNNMNTYDFSYGAESNIQFPWSMTLSTSISNSCRRGYSSAEMNRDELVWNAQLSQNFLRGNAATVSLQVFDILHNQSNISRNISASQRRDTEYNSINSYCMLHFIYRLNIFGSKEARQHMRDMRRRGGGFDGPGGGPGGFGGPPPGGFGGGRGRM